MITRDDIFRLSVLYKPYGGLSNVALKNAAEMAAFLFDIVDYESSILQQFSPQEKKEKDSWDHSDAMGRYVLIPEVIAPIAGFSASQILRLIRNSLTGRFLNDEKFHNYAYARDIKDIWMTLRKFVSSALGHKYADDEAVAADGYIQNWCDQMRSESGVGMWKFPQSISTMDDLVDIVAMCIHIAAPQHTAVNFLQQYYQTFVPNKPSALFSPLLTSLSHLESYTESDLMAVLPLKAKRQWLLMAQISYLLSQRVQQDGNIVTNAARASKDKDLIIAAAGKGLSADLKKLANVFLENSKGLDDQNTAYNVLAPEHLANPIVI
ncbi:hypothetical protein PC9H_005937 [Pleurotus ostreatus]|uniref:Manganese lipoxygenase n=1 Tax=Pleurotus ostreatus TaxID=5322 RepID=A0A8H6ZVC5_PLEOS|nr:uncharacterized protein PC9H_005937 [Pleurotus ostreatus]KAF7430235.1 hypothetical protein PC9H_005937 [Pleurotus ostreatus]